MGYRIIYEEEGRPRAGASLLRRIVLTAVFFVLFLRLVSGFWPDGLSLLRDVCGSGNTVKAVQVFAQELESGFPIRNAAENFCGAVFGYETPY